jgi:tRNA 2-selenouridine synthase
MKNQPQHTDLLSLFLNNTPMLDVRAPIEYQQGSFPHTKNIAILEDSEREAIGIRYKEQGQDAAVALGEKLIQGEIKEQRIAQWQAFIERYPEGVLYCFRGGMRSQITQKWLKEQTGIEYPRVAGGYKTMRRFLIDSIERLANQFEIIVLSGRTGSGKTRLLKQLKTSIDLEGLANHRGSAFGPNPTPQPTQIDFENQLAIKMLKHEAQGHKMIVLEDEGHNIGSVRLPIPLHDAMKKANIVLMEVEDNERVDVTICEYVDDVQTQLKILNPNGNLFDPYAEYLLGSLSKINKRLGSERYTILNKKLQNAIHHQQQTGETDRYSDVFLSLLIDYYDPMYDYQISKKQQRIIHRGDHLNVLKYLHNMEPRI